MILTKIKDLFIKCIFPKGATHNSYIMMQAKTKINEV